MVGIALHTPQQKEVGSAHPANYFRSNPPCEDATGALNMKIPDSPLFLVRGEVPLFSKWGSVEFARLFQ